MRYSEERQRSRKNIEAKGNAGTFAKRVKLCILLLVFLVAVKLYPGAASAPIKESIKLIVNHNTNLQTEFEKIKAYFKKDESLKELSPVSDLLPPSSGKIIKGFGMQDASGSGFHYGVLIKPGEKENIVAANSGVVADISKSDEYGTFILIKHSDEISTLYGKLGEIIPDVGAEVEKGQAIARAGGENGEYYFELKRGETYLDPTQFIDFKE